MPTRARRRGGGSGPGFRGWQPFTLLRRRFSPFHLTDVVADLALAVEAARRAAALASNAAAEARSQAEAAKELAADALVAVADLRAVASATTVWLAFDGLSPDEGAGEVLRANRGVWMSAVTLERESFVAAKVCLLQDGDPSRWQRGQPLVLQVVPAIKDLGVAQGAGRAGKELQVARAKVAFDRLALIGRLVCPEPSWGFWPEPPASPPACVERQPMCMMAISCRPCGGG